MFSQNVPNAPCGVESESVKSSSFDVSMFLMHRVELKVVCRISSPASPLVPNAPCGVESWVIFCFSIVFCSSS